MFVKNFNKGNKLTPNFSLTTHTVVTTTASTGDVIIRNDETGEQHRRNIVHFKKVGGEWRPVNGEQGANASSMNDDKKTDEDTAETRMIIGK